MRRGSWLSDGGEIGEEIPGCNNEVYVVMPDHFHGNVVLAEEHQPAAYVGADTQVCPGPSESRGAPTPNCPMVQVLLDWGWS
jgi:hypothetical protein